jgi:peptide/nickel transport system substrate-binding protein
MRKFWLMAGVMMLALVAASSANAQKSQDTLRIAIIDQFPTLVRYHGGVDESTVFSRRVFDELIGFDELNGKIVPQLAKSWKQVDALTYEFDLRDDITFHNGNKFDADDVVETLNYVSDPASKVRNPERYSWIKSAEKLGPYKVRVIAKSPSPMAMGQLSYMTPILDKETFDALPDKTNYGRATPVGTGPYKVVDFGTTGLTVERFDGFKGDPKYTRAPVKRIKGIAIPDRQTQQAQLITGGVDLLRNVEPDAAADLSHRPNIGLTMAPGGSMLVLGFDAAGRTGNKPLTDARVRKAMWMAIDRDAIIKNIVPGGDKGVAVKMDGPCLAFNIGCKITTPPPAYDPAQAKKLLAEAGYADGFDLEYTVYAPIKAIAEAVAGEWRKVGIRATINSVPFNVYSKMRGDGKFQAYSVNYPTNNYPDVGTTLTVFFGDNRDYAHDDAITEAVAKGEVETDPVKREAIYRDALNRNNDMIYVMGLSSLPLVYAHSNDVKIEKSQIAATDAYINDFMWK